MRVLESVYEMLKRGSNFESYVCVVCVKSIIVIVKTSPYDRTLSLQQ